MRALWIFRDDDERGLEHGRHYNIQKETLKNGKVRVTVEEISGKITFADEEDFARHFKER